MPSDAAPALEFWFEFASTYSYIAAMRIEELCRDAGVRLVWKPFLLGPIFALQGWETSHFNLNPRRGAYMWRDMERLTEKLGLPWRRPSEFPRNTIVPARVACAVAQEPWCGDYVRAVYVANFGHDRAIDRRDVVAEILTEIGQPADAVLARAESAELRPRLRANTERAIELGIFGAPNCVVADELFWGEESLHDALDWALARKTSS
ncbi:MAG TPA: 2-hydroxychromene-2-carboxylate isomerase [Candidatus Elarobacter sp.]|jgi:2-hydroxychromene-2-carboxylate isomerase